MKRLLFALLAFMTAYLVRAQDITSNTIINNELASLVQNLQLQQVPTGYLLDRAVEAVDVRVYNGAAKVNE